MQSYFSLDSAAFSRVGQGSWYLDSAADRAQVIRAIQTGLDAGLTHIDTAEMYGDGDAETLLGEALRDRRDEAFLVSKVLPFNAGYDDAIAACERSLQRLQTDYLDSYLLHWRGQVPLEETVAAMEQLQQSGKIRSWGVSNFDVSDLVALYAIAGEGKIACNQVLYHLEERTIEHELIGWCVAHGINVVAYSPFGHDQFPLEGSAEGQVLAQIGQQYDASARQVALAFLCRRPDVFAIPKAASMRHVLDNAGALDLTLSQDDIANIDAAFPLQPHPGYLPMI
ncbi:aldo/keto reductase [Paenalcaligenes sp. Me131]|uniref:aldo/keto reductase n=1 Tax=Paenalcaligenes sp. Me131 TaxID=3392636 RepID=UPI003D273394